MKTDEYFMIERNGLLVIFGKLFNPIEQEFLYNYSVGPDLFHSRKQAAEYLSDGEKIVKVKLVKVDKKHITYVPANIPKFIIWAKEKLKRLIGWWCN